MKISATAWNTISKLLDEALDLESTARAAWLERLHVTQPQLASSVKQLLAAHATNETSDVLAGLPSIEDLTGPSAEQKNHLGLSAGDRVGPYLLKRELGAGGMADVWLAERADGAFARDLALKLPRINRLRRDLAIRFARERDILARLEHPHIARLYDAGVTDDGLAYLAMEFVDGQHITAYADQNRLTIQQRVALMLQVMEAVQYAHQAFIVHRDLKPGNILIDASGQAHLLDFGIAKLISADDAEMAGSLESPLTEAFGRTLTLRYAAPEQIEGSAITAATDVYGIGLIIAELLTGVLPRNFAANKVPAQAVLDAAITRPSRGDIKPLAAEARQASIAQLQSALKGDLDTIVMKSLARDPAQRYATVNGFADDLIAWLDHRPIRARAPSLAYQIKLFLLRNRWPVTMAVAIVMVASFAGFQSWKNNLALDEQRVRAERSQRFIASLLTESEPSSEKSSEPLTAKKLLDRGRERANSEYADQPQFRGEILGELARVYLRSGETAVGMETLYEAISLLEKHVPIDEPALNRARAQLGGMLVSGTERARGRALLEGVLRDCRRESAACDDAKGDAHLLLGYGAGLDLTKAVEHFVEALSLYRKVRGTNSVEAFQAVIAAAEFERMRGNLSAAKRWLSEAEAISEKTPLKREETLTLHNTRAAIALNDGDHALAAVTLDRLIVGSIASDLTDISGSMYALRASIALEQGKPGDALKSTAKARQILIRQESLVLFARIELHEVRAYALNGQHELAAQRILDAAATLKLANVTPTSELWHAAKLAEAEACARNGNYSKAYAVVTDSLNQQREIPMENFRLLVKTLDLLGAVLTVTGDASGAIKLHQEELEILDRQVDKRHPLRMRAALQLALATRAATHVNSNDINELALQLSQTLPTDSKYLEILLLIAAGASDQRQVLLLF
jgi:eukaryotic-like serine/threonine-protein kinase